MKTSRLIKVLKVLAAKKAVKEKKEKELDKEEISRFMKLYPRLAKYLDPATPKFHEWVKKFDSQKKYDLEGEDVYKRAWEDNFYSCFSRRYLSVFDRREHANNIEEYQKFMAEQAGELDNPNWYVESGPVISMFDDIKSISSILDSGKVLKNENLVKLNMYIESLLKNVVDSSWYYNPDDFSDVLHFLNYCLKNKY